MKKILMFATALLLLMSMGTVCISAVAGTWVTDAESFQPVGNIAIEWDPDASTKLNLSDGKMDDWAAAGYSPTQINPENLVSWVGTTADNMPEGFHISSYFVADKDYLYIGFFIVDPNSVYGAKPDAYNSDGDAFQVMVDFAGRLQDMQLNRPDEFEALKSKQCIFYSFDCDGDGVPLRIMKEQSDDDGYLSEADGDPIKGAGSKTETGWCAEFALSWEMMYEDYEWKAYEDEDTKIYFGGAENKRFDCGIALYYLNVDTTGGGITWAAGTMNGVTDENGGAVVNWEPLDCGIHLYLEYQEGMEFSCENLVVLGPTETEPPTEEKTEAPTEPATDPVTEAPTQAVTEAKTEGKTEAGTPAVTTPDKDVSGCASVIGVSAGIILLTAAVVVLKKRV